jgi:heterogeneous nuclear rnp K-like protein 2
MGTIIGRNGSNIKQIQESAGVRLVAQKEMLPRSTERVIVVYGSPEAVQQAVLLIGKTLIDDWQRGTNAIPYHPSSRKQTGNLPGGRRENSSEPGGSVEPLPSGNYMGGMPQSNSRAENVRDWKPRYDVNGEEIVSENISIPADMVGCIIGRGGSKITVIRTQSGARISIAKVSLAARRLPRYTS